jgi:hypothetical protein
LIDVLTKLIDSYTGIINIDDHDLKQVVYFFLIHSFDRLYIFFLKINKAFLFKYIDLISNDILLFNKDIEYNILYGNTGTFYT